MYVGCSFKEKERTNENKPQAFSCLAVEEALGIVFCISAWKCHCDLLVTHLSMLLVVQINELKWSEECQHIPQPRGLFITFFWLMGWGILV